jgi:O-acetylhomoserine/O-acetylserine sulfhydrylase-like pyridoxal-dependent enzyme
MELPIHFGHEVEGCFLCSRHWNPTNKVLADALARMEAGEAAAVMSSGVAVRNAIGPRVKVLYCESISNPLLEVNDIPKLDGKDV